MHKSGLLPQAALALLVSLVGVGGGCAATRTASDPVGNVHNVVPGVLVRGAQFDERNLQSLHDSYGIKSVINLNDSTARSEEPWVKSLGMTYLALPSDAFRPEPEKVLTFLRAMKKLSAAGPVYVHCRQGMDRTGLAVAAYRIVVQDWDAKRAMAEMRSHQAFGHAMLFPRLDAMVQTIYRDRERWRAQLEEKPANATAAVAVR
jgi:protein tyrosine/serine phosphatase